MSHLPPTATTGIEVPAALIDMKMPRLRELARQLRFSPDEGRIWMGQRRVVLVQAHTFAALRGALIDELGMDAARGLLTRIYFDAGRRDAEDALKAAGPGASLSDVLHTGAMLHALQGYLLPENVGVGLTTGDLRSDDYCGEALWTDSLEAEAHVAHVGVGPDPVCWNAVGYCSGYLSQCAGRIILVREVECRASGSTHCKIVAKPAAMWDDAADDLRYLLPASATAPGGPVPARTLPAVSAPAPATGPGDATPGSAPGSITGPGVAGAGDTALLPAPFVGASTAFHVLQHKIDRVAPTQATVLLLGESGVGKSLIARELHRRSTRAPGPFVEVNCAAIPEPLIESELFGVERGAFSGATHSRQGRFEAAHGSTLFLDEIGSLSMTAQGKLLRVLQTGQMERLGSNQTISTDVRVLAATNQDLKLAVREGRFREDLYFRLNVFPIVVQPLRQRRDDIVALTDMLLARLARRHGRPVTGISDRAMQALLQHDWPGNVRELENMLERAVIMVDGQALLDLHHFAWADDTLGTSSYFGIGPMGRLTATSGSAAPDDAGACRVQEGLGPVSELAEALVQQGRGQLPEIEDALVRAALRQAGGNITRAAGLLGITRAQMDYRAKKVGGTAAS